MNRKIYGTVFYENKISDYGKKNGRVDYDTLSKAFDKVLNNNIMKITRGIGVWEQIHGFIDNSEEIKELEEMIEALESEIAELNEEIEELEEMELEVDETKVAECESKKEEIEELEDKIRELEEEENIEISQYYIISAEGAEILMDWTDGIIFYNETLDMYVWGITHWGTDWKFTLTDIEIVSDEDIFE